MITLQEFFQKCEYLPDSIKSHTLQQFRQVFSSQEARDAKNVLYVFVCEKKIPRVKGKSNIIYIGKTKQTLRKRYMQYVVAFYSGENSPLYRYIITHYGGIEIAYKPFGTAESLKQAETELLNDYYKLYKEYPPRNFQRR